MTMRTVQILVVVTAVIDAAAREGFEEYQAGRVSGFKVRKLQ